MNTDFRSNRILSLDLFRGIAILGVVLVHALIFGVFSSIDIALNVIPPGVFLLFIPFVLFAPMAGLFVFISTMTNGMILQKRLDQGHSLRASVQPVLITSIALLILHFIFPAVFNHSNTSMFTDGLMIDAFIPASIAQGRPVMPRFENFLLMDAMAMISMAGFFFVILALVLFRRNSKSTVEQKMFRLCVLGFVWVFAAPFVWGGFWKLLNFFYFKEGALRLLAIPVSFFAAKIHPITTTAPFAIFGTWFALFLYTAPEYSVLKKKARRIGFIMIGCLCFFVGFKAFLCFAKENAVYNLLERIGVVDWLALNTPPKNPAVDTNPSLIAGDFKNAIFNFHVLPPELLMLGMSICFFFFPLFIGKLDYCSDSEKNRLARKIAPIQRFGTVSLTVFFWESTVFSLIAKCFHMIPSLPNGEGAGIFSWLYRFPFWITPRIEVVGIDAFMHMWPLWLFYLFIVAGLWFLVLKIWSYIGFRFSMEWLLVNITRPFRKIRSTKLDAATDKSIYTSHK